MAFVFPDKVAALDDLIAAGDPSADRLARDLLADRDHHLSAVAGLVRLDLARRDYDAAFIHGARLVRMRPERLDFLTLNAAIAWARERHRDVLAILRKAEAAGGADATLLVIAMRSAKALGERAILDDLCRTLARFGALSQDAIAQLDQSLDMLPERPGWVSVTADGGLLGSLRRDGLEGAEIVWRKTGEPERRRALREVAVIETAGDVLRFSLPRRTLPDEGRLRFFGAREEWLGSPIALPAHPALRGMVGEGAKGVYGWASAPGDPDRPIDVEVTDSAGRTTWITAGEPSDIARALGSSSVTCGFTFDLDRHDLQPGPISFRALGVPLSGSPMMVEARSRRASALAPFRRAAAHALPRDDSLLSDALAVAPIPAGVRGRHPAGRIAMDRSAPRAVLVPVYDGRDETLACLASVIETVPADVRILVVDDASPDPDLSDELAELERRGRIELLRNPVNLGYPGSVNRGLERLTGFDVVLLNADSIVAGNWLDRLTAASRSAPDIGTVTALAPSGSIAGYAARAQDQAPETIAATDRAAARANPGLVIDVPTGVGHCLYVRADCFAAVGRLDALTFGRGYGEENDFCLRASALGFRNVVAADVFVGHLGERSFGAQRRILSHRNGLLIERLYPGYDALVARHVASDPLAGARRRIDLARLRSGPPAVLLVTMGLKGGVATHLDARLETLRTEGYRALTLQSLAPTSDAGPSATARCRLAVDDQPDLEDLIYTQDEFGPLMDLLQSLRIERIEIHHTLHHHPQVFDLPALLAVPYEIVVHDYSWICPRMALVDGSGRYCGVPDAAACERCVTSFGSISQERITVADLRARSRAFFADADRVVVPCRDVATRLEPHLGRTGMTVVPWDDARPLGRPEGATENRAPDRLVVALPGAIGFHKGFEVLKACADDARARHLPLEFVLLGNSEDDNALFATKRVFVTGTYEAAELPALLEASRAELALLPSVCPETWSYTLSEIWRSGFEVLAFDLGAIAERIRAHGGGRLLPIEATPAMVNDALLAWKRPGFTRSQGKDMNAVGKADDCCR
ncbi:glycosyltransferase [Fulvimarina endophytica]|uniref:Glycosyltransferase n=1 Tax=Fulvimarina endophytica TaxID=2293836 RepID=A0A371WYX0_9HYPH|nr:glycosyltransferase [Fulvimarina endophytica]RFC62173.1 glycosyltransferase [Fulvimarina endophytica]